LTFQSATIIYYFKNYTGCQQYALARKLFQISKTSAYLLPWILFQISRTSVSLTRDIILCKYPEALLVCYQEYYFKNKDPLLACYQGYYSKYPGPRSPATRDIIPDIQNLSFMTLASASGGSLSPQ
jgi:hypothetical protein